METYFIGIDIGTSKICGIIYNTGTKRRKSVVKENNSGIKSIIAGQDIQDPQKIVTIVKEIIEELTAQCHPVAGIGITGQMHGILYVDKKGDAISPLYTWQDGSGNRQYKNGCTYAEFLTNITGYRMATGFGLTTHFYHLKSGLVPAGTNKLCTIMDYTAMKLSSTNIPMTDSSNAASLGLFDPRKLEFDAIAIKKADIDPFMLPQVVHAGDIRGKYQDINICTPIGDNQASFLGSVKEIRNTTLINIGTSSQVSVYSDQYVSLEQVDVRPFPGGGYILVGSALCGGYSMVVLKQFFEKTIRFFCGEPECQADFYDKINMPGKSFPLSDNEPLYVEVFFRGTRSDPEKRGTIQNISVNNLTPENLIMGIINGISNESLSFYSQFPEQIKSRMKHLVGSGNAIRRNPILTRAIDRAYNGKIEIPDNSEEAAFGACIAAMVGCRYLQSFFSDENIIQYK